MARQARSEESRRRLVEAAAVLFATKGYGATTIDAVAEAAGISRGSIFWHFRTKEGLLWAVTERAFASWATDGLLGDVGDQTGLEAIRRAMTSHRAVLRREREIFRLYHVLMADALGPRPEMAPTFLDLHEYFRGLAVKWLRGAMEAGEVAGDLDPEGLATALVAAMSGLAGHWLLDPEGVDLDRAYGQLALLVERGLRPEKRPTPPGRAPRRGGRQGR